jgi:HNH endonuclease
MVSNGAISPMNDPLLKRTRNRRNFTDAEIMRSFMKTVEFETNTGCWLWSGKCCPQGYGRVAFKAHKIIQAHRMSVYLHRGEKDVAPVLMHRCDTPSCVNPDHLEWGTVKQNCIDGWVRGKVSRRVSPVRGTNSALAVLTDEQVVGMRQMRRWGEKMQKIAEVYGVSRSCVTKAIYGISYADIPGALAQPKRCANHA